MKSLSKLSIFVVTALSLASGNLFYFTKPALSGKDDNINVFLYCSSNQKALTGSTGWAITALPFDQENVRTWHCLFDKADRQSQTVELSSKDLNMACIQQYPDTYWMATFRKQTNPFSWYCDSAIKALNLRHLKPEI